MESPEYDDHPFDYCYGMQFITETMNVDVTMEVEVKECNFGLFGLMIGDYTDCYWRTYNIDQPLAQVEFLHALDIDSRNYYFPWSCNYNLLDDAGVSIQKLGQPTQMGDADFDLDFYFRPNDTARWEYELSSLITP